MPTKYFPIFELDGNEFFILDGQLVGDTEEAARSSWATVRPDRKVPGLTPPVRYQVLDVDNAPHIVMGTNFRFDVGVISGPLLEEDLKEHDGWMPTEEGAVYHAQGHPFVKVEPSSDDIYECPECGATISNEDLEECR
jgi:hypothetical protein